MTAAPIPGELTLVDDRARRILDAAVRLAESGGFSAVRLRDVAQASGVALGTVYKRFRSKEDLLVGVLSLELVALRERFGDAPLPGATRLDRLIECFAALTETLCARPHLGRAVIRSAATGENALAERLHRFHSALMELIVGAIRGRDEGPVTATELEMLAVLQDVWFSRLVGWTAELHGPETVVEQVARAARLLYGAIEGAGSSGEIRSGGSESEEIRSSGGAESGELRSSGGAGAESGELRSSGGAGHGRTG
ncbi:TetR/AcrR family transcriptional regulator [Nannocystis radixulma]|uniref:TetR/AcrR family transcriptional regulator n=1 Tax=Nannocystis radixulma TaxID=2995305 RepID=A0ABT5BIY1_9BACT|nr:TetR/AcrR family transcriptional regulator [Nannocystis radixulma]MDC0674111.1 TetR/AcrR family transcriptional regulator [Nannocystis radixulma]